MEAITVSPAEIIYHRRVQVFEHARRTSVSQACRTFGVSRTSYYRWLARAEEYGVEALMPKTRRKPAMPNATPAWIVEIVLADAVVRPTLGAARLADVVADHGIELSPSGVAKILRRHHLGRRKDRLAALAQLTASINGVVTPEAATPFGFCHWAGRPGELVAMDTFYVGQLKGIGKVYQLTAIDTHTRWAVAELIVGAKTAASAARFLKHVLDRFRELGAPVERVLTDNGPEFVGTEFRAACDFWDIDHVRIPPRSPNHNAVCERFQGTVLQEFYRPAFHRQRFERIADLDVQLQSWLEHYNYHRRNHSDYMRSRAPFDILIAHLP